MTDKTRVFSITLPDGVYQQLRKAAFERDEKLASLVRRMIKFSLPHYGMEASRKSKK